MKQNSQGLIFLFFLCLLFSNSRSARLLAPTQGDTEVVKANEITHASSLTEMKDLTTLMGSEECDDKDEECLRRRMIAEAHLDYIYTQHHKP